ncbi:MAG: histidinol-phosphate transaminase [Gammaproteobacteria bacterium]
MTCDFSKLAVPGVRGLMPYLPGKPLAELEREYGVKNADKLASNENPLGPSPRAVEAMSRALTSVWLYPDGNGFNLKQKLADVLGVAPQQITLGNGSSDILDFVVRAFVSPDSEVVFSQHAFAVYPILTQMAGATAVVSAARNWGHDLPAMRAAVTERTRLVFIANPNNPTGTWLPGTELEAFIRDLPAHVIVVVDEAYFEYARAPQLKAEGYPNSLDWLERYPNLVVSRTFSKVYGLAGLRIGYGVSHPQLAELLNRVRPPFNVNALALEAAVAALEDTQHLQRSLAVNSQGMVQLTTGLGALGLDYIPSVGNFVAVDMGRDAAPIYEALLHEGVIVRPLANYQMPQHLRVTIGSESQNARVLAALQKVLS